MTWEKLQAVRAELQELERQAGIAKECEDARMGSLFPDLKATPTEYFRDTEDYARRQVRDLYFTSVADPAVRKTLIAERRECEKARTEDLRHEVAEARKTLKKTLKAVDSPWPWFIGACVAAVCVAIGARWFQVYGAIYGAVIGLFLGHYALTQEREKGANNVRRAQSELDDWLKNDEEMSFRPDWFNAREEETGERDDYFDRESVLANAARGRR